MAREIDHRWSLQVSGSTGGQDPIEVHGDVVESAFYVQASSGATNTIALQSGMASTGPWFTEASTTVAAGVGSVMRITGPFLWVRAHIATTGGSARFIGVS